ncbi:hypothetical protein WA026_008300, partial [Henosepilachna vigintioctopunctata]
MHTFEKKLGKSTICSIKTNISRPFKRLIENESYNTDEMFSGFPSPEKENIPSK